MLNYVYRFDIAAVFIILAVIFSYYKSKTINTKTTQAFNALTGQALISCILDIVSVFLLKYFNPSLLWLNYIVNIVYYIFFNAIPLCFYICLYYLSENNKEMPRKKFWVFFGMNIFMGLLTISTPITKFIFYFDENLIFRHGAFFYVYYFLDLFYIGEGLKHFFKKKRNFNLNKKISLIFYTSSCIVATIFQLFFPEIMVMGFIFSLSILITFLSLENPQDYIDKDFKFYNRQAFIVKAQENYDKKKKMYILGIGCESLNYITKAIGIENRKNFFDKITDYLQTCCDKKSIFRISYNKVALMLQNVGEEKYEELIKNIWNHFQEPIKVGDVEISISVVLKAIECPKDVDSVEDLLDLLDDSLEVKSGSEEIEKNIKVDVDLLEKRRREHKILQILEHAIDSNDFEVVYQPIYSVNTGKYSTAEALIRLKNSEIGYISPEEFIPLAEKNGMILKIGNFVFKEVCSYISENRIWEKGIEFIHVNLSVVQCMQERLYEQLLEIMDFYKLDYQYINLEVTETTAIASSDILLKNMNILMEKNVKFSLDDYGTGFSNTSTLIKYPFNIIKLDKTMINGAVKDQKAQIVLQKTVNMVKDLSMQVVAEGIENAGEQELVLEIGCDYIQGHLYSYPLSANDFLAFMER